MGTTEDFDSWIILSATAILGVTVSFSLRFNWWQSGLFTAGIMIGGEYLWNMIFHNNVTPIAREDLVTVFRSFLPVGIYWLGIGWIVTHPATLGNLAVGLLLGISATGWVVYEMRLPDQNLTF